MRAYVEAYGCTLNQGEACEVREVMRSLGWSVVSDPAVADVSVLVACVVIEATENRMMKRLRELSAFGRVIVTGCMATARMEAARAVSPSAEFVPPGDVADLARVVGRVGPRVDDGSADEEVGFAIVPIATGCRGECSYCITRLARGTLRSRPPEDIVARVAVAASAGPLEIRMTAQDSAAYGGDIGTNLPSLMMRVSALEEDFRVRLGMMNPDSVAPFVGRLPELYSDRRVFKFLHLPVQSASDRLLAEMGRRYSLADFERTVSVFRTVAPETTLSTDIIVGYPGETEEDHRANLGLIRRARPDIVNVTRYSARPGTKAFDLGGGVAGWRAKDRSRELTEARFEVSLERNERMVGSSGPALATERGKNDSTILRTDEYRQVVVKERLSLRRYYEVTVESATPTYLVGSVPPGNR